MNPIGLLLVLAGLFSVGGAVFDWDFFFHHRKAQLFVGLLGRTGARVVYFLLGLGISILGVLITMGVLRDA